MKNNILEENKVSKTIWKLGLPMIVSMILQALYNVIDTAFVINMGSDGEIANLALTYAFPIQILMIAVGVGTGVGINVLLSKSLGEGNKEKASMVAGTGIFIGIILYLIFMIFGFVGSRWFISLQANGNIGAINMGEEYLKIVCTLSIGSIGFAVAERFLQATGKTMYSTIAQIVGALLNIILDYVFIYPCNMGIAGAAIATIIGQIASLVIAFLFHIFSNKEISKNIKYIKPDINIIKEIYYMGLSALQMQALLSVMMFGVNLILGTSNYYVILQGSFGIYYKIAQLALFACFGLSNALITIVSFNYGMKNKQRLFDTFKYGLIISIIVSCIILILFEILAYQIAYIFGISSGDSGDEIINTCTYAIRIASIGYIFMGITVGIQGLLQGIRKATSPLILSLLRLVVFIFPLVYIFTLTNNPQITVWIAFPITELLTATISIYFYINALNKNIKTLKIEES